MAADDTLTSPQSSCLPPWWPERHGQIAALPGDHPRHKAPAQGRGNVLQLIHIVTAPTGEINLLQKDHVRPTGGNGFNDLIETVVERYRIARRTSRGRDSQAIGDTVRQHHQLF